MSTTCALIAKDLVNLLLMDKQIDFMKVAIRFTLASDFPKDVEINERINEALDNSVALNLIDSLPNMTIDDAGFPRAIYDKLYKFYGPINIKKLAEKPSDEIFCIKGIGRVSYGKIIERLNILSKVANVDSCK